MSLNMQVKLLRVMQEREFERVGGKERIKRMFASSQRPTNLEGAGGARPVSRGSLLPAQCHSNSTFLHCVNGEKTSHYWSIISFINSMANSAGKSARSDHVRCSHLSIANGPKLRQLENVLRRAVVHTHGEFLSEEVLDEPADEPIKSELRTSSSQIKLLDEVEKEHILNALKFAGGNRGKVCELLGISRPTLQRKIRKYGIEI